MTGLRRAWLALGAAAIVGSSVGCQNLSFDMTEGSDAEKTSETQTLTDNKKLQHEKALENSNLSDLVPRYYVTVIPGNDAYRKGREYSAECADAKRELYRMGEPGLYFDAEPGLVFHIMPFLKDDGTHHSFFHDFRSSASYIQTLCLSTIAAEDMNHTMPLPDKETCQNLQSLKKSDPELGNHYLKKHQLVKNLAESCFTKPRDMLVKLKR